MAENQQHDAEPVPSFEVSLERLETIVKQLEDEQLGLTQSLEKYEEGVRLLKSCYASLRDAERKIQLLTGVDEEGNAALEDFEHEATKFEGVEKESPRRIKKKRVRKSTGQGKSDVDDVPGLF